MLIKTTGASRDPAYFAALQGIPNVVVIDRMFSRAQVNGSRSKNDTGMISRVSPMPRS